MLKAQKLDNVNGGYCVVHGIPTMHFNLPSGIVIRKHTDNSPCSYLDSWDPNVGSKYVTDRAALLDLNTISLEDLYVLVSDATKLSSYLQIPFPGSLANLERIYGYLVKKRMVLPFSKDDPIMDEVSALSLYSMIYRGLVPPLIRNYITTIDQKYIRIPDKRYFAGMTMNDLKLFTGESADGSQRMMLGFFLVTDSDFGAFRVLPQASMFAWDMAIMDGRFESIEAVARSVVSRIGKSSSDFLVQYRSDVSSLVHYLESFNMNDLADELRGVWKDKFRSDLV